MIVYKIEENLSPDEFKEVLVKSTLGKRRPIEEPERIKKMIVHSNLIITARKNGVLIGVSRSLTDFQFCTYLSDLAVDKKYQKQGIGKELIKQTKEATPNATLILLSAPEATSYYPKIGLHQFEQCYVLRDIKNIK